MKEFKLNSVEAVNQVSRVKRENRDLLKRKTLSKGKANYKKRKQSRPSPDLLKTSVTKRITGPRKDYDWIRKTKG